MYKVRNASNRSFCANGESEDGFCEDPVEYPQELVEALLAKMAQGGEDASNLKAFFDGGSAGLPVGGGSGSGGGGGKRKKNPPRRGGFGGGSGGSPITTSTTQSTSSAQTPSDFEPRCERKCSGLLAYVCQHY